MAFEPHSENSKYLVLNVIMNGVNNVKLFPLALLNRVGLVKMIAVDASGEHSCKHTGAGTSKTIYVPAVPLDLYSSTLKSQER